MESKPLAMFEQQGQCRAGFVCPLFPGKRLFGLDNGLIGLFFGRCGGCESVERCLSLSPRLWGVEPLARCRYPATKLYGITIVRKLCSPLHQRRTPR